MKFTGKLIKLEMNKQTNKTTLSMVTQTQKDNYQMFPLTCESQLQMS